MRTSFHGDSAANIGHDSNPEMNALLDKAQVAVDEDERRELFEEMQEVFRDWLPYMPQIKHTTGWYVGPKVGGFPGARPGSNNPDFRLLYIAD